MSDIILSSEVKGFKSNLNIMYTAGNLSDKSVSMPLPNDASVEAGASLKLVDIKQLTEAVNILETQFSGNCNCTQNTSKCQSCQTNACQSCQSQCNCNCNCNCCSSGDDDGSNY